MAPHSSTLAWKIPWTEEPGRLQSMGSLESDTTERLHFHFSLSCIGEGKWQPTPVFLPGESQEWASLVGCRLWGHTGLCLQLCFFPQNCFDTSESFMVPYEF